MQHAVGANVVTASLDPFRGYATALNTQLPDAVRVLDPFHVVKLALACIDDARRRVQQTQTGHRGRTGDPLYGIRRVPRRRRDRLSSKAWGRLEAGLVAGDPTGEVTVCWTVAQDLMALYQLTDPVAARKRAATLIADLRPCPGPRAGPPRAHPARLAPGAVRALRSPRCQQRPHPEPQLEDQKHEASRPRIPQLHPLPTPPIAQPRPNPQRSLTDTNQNPRSQVRCVEPLTFSAGKTPSTEHGVTKCY